MFYQPGDSAEPFTERDRVVDGAEVGIEQEIAVVGSSLPSSDGSSTEAPNLIGDHAGRKIEHLQRRTERSELLDQFRLVDDHDEPRRHLGNHLLPGMGPTGTFGEIEPRIDLIGSIDRYVEAAELVGWDDLDAERPCQHGGLIRSRRADDVEARLHQGSEFEDREMDGGTRAEADAHAIRHVAGRVAPGLFFCRIDVLGHRQHFRRTGPVVEVGGCPADGAQRCPSAYSRASAADSLGKRSRSNSPKRTSNPWSHS